MVETDRSSQEEASEAAGAVASCLSNAARRSATGCCFSHDTPGLEASGGDVVVIAESCDTDVMETGGALVAERGAP